MSSSKFRSYEKSLSRPKYRLQWSTSWWLKERWRVDFVTAALRHPSLDCCWSERSAIFSGHSPCYSPDADGHRLPNHCYFLDFRRCLCRALVSLYVPVPDVVWWYCKACTALFRRGNETSLQEHHWCSPRRAERSEYLKQNKRAHPLQVNDARRRRSYRWWRSKYNKSVLPLEKANDRHATNAKGLLLTCHRSKREKSTSDNLFEWWMANVAYVMFP